MIAFPSYDFTKNWFAENSLNNWDKIIPIIDPSKILELGSHEGVAACYLIDSLGKNKPLEIHCVDVWDECEDVSKEESKLIEARFDKNLSIAIKNSKNKINLFKHKNKSHVILSEMIVNGINDFDLIYIDASHYAQNVLTDAVLSYRLLKTGGMIIFDDYLWSGDEDILYYPKIAIDSFVNVFSHDIKLIPAPLTQVYAVKINEFIKK